MEFKYVCFKDFDDYFNIGDVVIVKKISKNNYRVRKINKTFFYTKVPSFEFKSHFKTLKGESNEKLKHVHTNKSRMYKRE